MTDQLLQQILAELTAIRLLLAAKSTGTTAAPAQSAQTGATDGPPPQPRSLIENPGDVQVHFGKNTGVPLSSLQERSLRWYCEEPAPRLDNAGKPFPPRPQDTLLRNAARQLWHQQAGTLVGAAPAGNSGAFGAQQDRTSNPPPQRTAQQVNLDEENPPF